MATNDTELKSELILAELKKRQHSRGVVDVEGDKVKVVIFFCGANRYAFYGDNITEILPTCDISWVPSLPDYLPGLINIRGDIESVIDIRYFLGEEKVDREKYLIAMAAHEGFHSGVIIDSIEDVVDIPQSSIHPPLATLNGAAGDLVTGEIEYDGATISLLDIGKLAALITI